MNNKELTGLIISQNLQISSLITIWGLTNYLSQSQKLGEIVLLDTTLFKYINIKVNGNIVYGASVFYSLLTMIPNLLKLSNM